MSKQAVQYVGRTTDFKGKSLWHIVGNLKDFGVGRIVIRHMFQRYKEPCFFKILKVEAQPGEVEKKVTSNASKFQDGHLGYFIGHQMNVRTVQVTVERVWRGVKWPEPHIIRRASYKADYQLIPKHLEKNFVATMDQADKIDQKLLQRQTEFPPLLKRFLAAETGDPNVKLELDYFCGPDSLYRVAKEGETPTVSFKSGLGTPVSPNLYKNVKRD